MSSSEQSDWQLVEKDSLAKIEPPRRPPVPVGMTRKELIVVHLTATTVASCGMHFEQELMRSVSSTHPEFESLFQFLNPTDSRRGFFDEVTLVYVYGRSLPPYSEYTSGFPSTGIEVFLNGLRLILDHEEKVEEEEEGETKDFPYRLETDDCVDWPYKPIRCQHPTSPYPSEGGLDASRDCEWYDWTEKQKEYNWCLSTVKDDPDHCANLDEHVGAFYDHYPYCNRRRFTVFNNNLHDARCEDCGQQFCSLCTQNVHFPATCTEMKNWKARVYLGPEHFKSFNAAVDAWERFDSKHLALAAKKKSFLEDFRLPFWAIYEELQQIIHLLRWTLVVAWHAPTYRPFRYCAVATLEESFDELFVAASEQHVQDLRQYHYYVQERRIKASTAALSVLSIIARFRELNPVEGMRHVSVSVSHEIEFWRKRPLRGCPPP